MFSQNGAALIATPDGQPDYSSPDLVRNPIPGTLNVVYAGGLLRGDVDVVLRYVGAYWNRFIEPVTDFWTGSAWVPQNWGFNLRPIRGQTLVGSNHGSGTATDTNSGEHPLGTQTLSPNQLRTLRDLAKALRGVVRFGAFYVGRKDEMHAEIDKFGQPLAELAADIRAGRMEVNFPELVTNPDPTRNSEPATPSKPQTSKPVQPADWWDTVDEAQARRVVNEEVGKVIQSDGVTGAGDLGRLGAYLEPLVRRWVNEEITKVSESQGFAGSADRSATIRAFRDAGILTPGVTDDQIIDALVRKLA